MLILSKRIIALVSVLFLLSGCYNGDTDSFLEAFEVAELDIASIEIQATNGAIETSQTQQYTVVATKNSGSTIDISDQVVYSSDDSNIASVNSSGVATGAGVGITHINASYADFTDSIQLEVSDRPLQSITISFVDTSLDASEIPVCTYGYQLRALGDYSLAADGSDERDITNLVSWTSSAAAIADVNSSNQTLASFSAGVANITASRSFPTTVAATVSNALATTIDNSLEADSIEVTRADDLSNTSMVIGTSRQYVAKAAYLIDGTVTDPKLDITETAVWSLDPSTSTVVDDPNSADAKGNVTALAVGDVTLVATCEAETGNIAINVIAAATLSSVRIDYNDEQTEKIIKNEGDSDFQLQAFAVFSDGNETEITDDDDTTWFVTSGDSVSVSNANGSEGEVSVLEDGISVVEVQYEGEEDTIVIEIEN